MLGAVNPVWSSAAVYSRTSGGCFGRVDIIWTAEQYAAK